MSNLKVLTTAAALGLAALMPMPSFAQHGHGGGMHMGGGHMMGGGARFAAGGFHGGGWHGGGWHGGGWHGGGWHHGGGFWPGAVAGAVIGGALASTAYPYGGYGYYDDPGYYYGPGYYDDDATVAVVPGDNNAAYCAQRYRSYDPASGTYLGYDGARHPCP